MIELELETMASTPYIQLFIDCDKPIIESVTLSLNGYGRMITLTKELIDYVIHPSITYLKEISHPNLIVIPLTRSTKFDLLRCLHCERIDKIILKIKLANDCDNDIYITTYNTKLFNRDLNFFPEITNSFNARYKKKLDEFHSKMLFKCIYEPIKASGIKLEDEKIEKDKFQDIDYSVFKKLNILM